MDAKKVITSSLKIGISLGMGVFFIWLIWRTLTPEDIKSITHSFGIANYWWILVSIVAGVLSHLSRAYRWKFTLEPLGLKPRFLNSFFAVMIGYLLNLAFPRLGEISRCASMSKYENMPINKLLGTVIAERVADLIIFVLSTATIILLQVDLLKSLMEEQFGDKFENFSFIGLAIKLGVVAVIGVVGLIILFKKSHHPIINKIKEFVEGLLDGLQSIITMKKKWAFLAHTIFIWLMYIVMFYVSMLSLESTSDVPILGILAAFMMGGLSIILVQGGLGVYPAAIMGTLLLYGVDKNDGLALGWIMWSGQTMLLILMGFFAMILQPIYNRVYPRTEKE